MVETYTRTHAHKDQTELNSVYVGAQVVFSPLSTDWLID